MSLRLDYCEHEAAVYAVKHWHYSHRMPAGKLVKIGVWENDAFIGVVLFGCGASPPLFKRLKTQFGIDKWQACELVRVALRAHQAPVSRIVAIAIRLLRRHCPGLRLIVSFADSDEGHAGGIYQAGNWMYTGKRMPGIRVGYMINGCKVHCRSMPSLGLRNTFADAIRRDPNAKEIIGGGKHQYFMPLDDEMRAKLKPLVEPYPKKQTQEPVAP